MNRQQRRTEPRFRVASPGVMTDSTGHTELVSIVNVSASGLMMHVPVPLRATPGCRLQVEYLGVVSRGVIRHVSPARYGVFVGLELDR